MNARRGTEESHMKTLKGRDERRKTSFDSSLMSRLQKRRQSVVTSSKYMTSAFCVVCERLLDFTLHRNVLLIVFTNE